MAKSKIPTGNPPIDTKAVILEAMENEHRDLLRKPIGHELRKTSGNVQRPWTDALVESLEAVRDREVEISRRRISTYRDTGVIDCGVR